MSRAGEVACITGGAKGLGFAIGSHLASLGCTVVLMDMDRKGLEASCAKLADRKVSYEVLNVCEPSTIQTAFDNVIARHGRIDILVQSAGVVGKTGIKTEQVELDNFDFVMNVNIRGIFLCCKAVLPTMAKQNYGRIVNIASIAGKEGNAGMLAYSTSKAAVVGLTKVVGKEYAETGITCNAIAPAVVRTAMVDAMPDSQVKYMTDKIPMKRCGRLDEIATLAAFISERGASFTTGFTFDATGGRATY